MTPVVHEDLSRPHRRAVAVVTDADTIHPQVEAVHMDGPSRSGVAMRCDVCQNQHYRQTTPMPCINRQCMRQCIRVRVRWQSNFGRIVDL
jgi:hypothetical protein